MVESVESLEEILEPRAGQVVFNRTDGKYYRFDPIEEWQYIPEDGETTLAMNIYDLNKQIIGQLEILDEEAMEEKKKLIRNFCNETNNEYYMLLCRDINYYTVFKMDVKLADEPINELLIECAQNIGEIKAIDLTEDGGAIELWMTYSDETYVAYFFPYDAGVIVCG